MTNTKDNICTYLLVILITFTLTFYVCKACKMRENFSQNNNKKYYNIQGKKLNDEQLLYEKKMFIDEMNDKCTKISSEKNNIDNIIEKKCKEVGINNKTNCYNFIETKISLDNDTQNICRVANNVKLQPNDNKIVLKDTYFDNTNLLGYDDK